MTLPDERYRAIKDTATFLLGLAAGPKLTPGVPKRIREEARRLLRHYPSGWDMQQLAQAAPDLVQERMEPLHRMVMAYEQLTPEKNSDGNY